MTGYRVLSPVQIARVRHEAGTVIQVDADIADGLVAAGVLVADNELKRDPDNDFANETPAPAGGGEVDRKARLLAAIDGLDPDNPAHWTKSGKPQVEVLEAMSGLAEVTATERDAVWTGSQARAAYNAGGQA